MGLFSKCMFTEVEGVVLLNGEPVEGAEVISSYDWSNKDERKSKKLLTDSYGKFSFPEWSSKQFLSSILPMEPVIRQEIIIEYKGERYTAWAFNKHSYGRGDETGKSPIKLVCDLAMEFKRHPLEGVSDKYYGICKLQEEQVK
ncbi:hypothetical protein KJY73_09915 [Bowmanella sp. Y26]|uniref:DUF4198 domain-containing protein n=1 Tax=Bowmanella yangjiangensis TaxID=2811230 RepID=UPI001BDBED8C|nr:DUF4198 domain-containing protein [Bowmanella yangjiangensis]MBT1063889.1 hypothetical protein [Bowmanella yangjiangensis]